MINVAKKNPYVFTIGFDETDLVHVRAAEILNGTKKKAQLIAAAILSYVDQEQRILKEILQELEKSMAGYSAASAGKEKQSSDSVLDLSSEEREMDETITQNIMEAMDTFRRN